MDGPWTDFQQSDTNTLPWEDFGGATAVAEPPKAASAPVGEPPPLTLPADMQAAEKAMTPQQRQSAVQWEQESTKDMGASLWEQVQKPLFGGTAESLRGLGEMAATGRKLTPEERAAAQAQESPAMKTATGAAEGLADLVDSFTSPVGIATLGMGTLPKVVQRATAAAFATQMLSQTPEQARELKKALDAGDTAKASRMAVGLVGGGIMGVMGAKHALTGGATIPGKITPEPFTSPEAQQPLADKAKATIPAGLEEAAKVLPRAAAEVAKIQPTTEVADEKKTAEDDGVDSTGTDGRPVLADQNDPNVPKVGETPPAGGPHAPVRPADAEVLTPAVRHDGKVYPAEPGQKNHGAIKLAQAKNGVDILEGEHGFVNKKGEFLTRAEAAKVFEDQTGKKPAKPGELHSEDLDQAGLLKHLDAPTAAAPSTLEQKLADPATFAGKDWTKDAYGHGAGATPEQLTELTALEKKYADEMKAVPKTLENLGKIGDIGKRKQFVTEALRFRRAMDEAKSTGAKTDAELAAIAKKHGIGAGRGGDDAAYAKDLKEGLAKQVSTPPKDVNEPKPGTHPELASAFKKFDETGEIETVRDLANKIESLVAEGKAPKSLLEPLQKYRAALHEDFTELAGRGNVEDFEDEFVSAVKKEIGGAAPATEKSVGKGATPKPVDVSAIKSAKTIDEVHAIGGKMLAAAKTGEEMQAVQKAMREWKPASTVRPPAASGATEMPHSPLAHVEGQVGAIKLKSNHKGTSNDAYTEAYTRLQKLRPELFSPTGSAPDQVVKSLNEGGFQKVTTDNLFDVLLGNHAEQVAIRAGDSPEGRADKFQKALDANAQKKSAQVVSVGDPNVGSEFSVGGEKFKVISIDPDTGEVTAKDGKKFAAQVIPDGADIPADKGSVKLNEGSTDFVPPEKTAGPKLGQGQTQGDLIYSTQSDTLSLTGEKGTDAERLQAAKDKAARDAAEAKAIQAKQQQNLLPPGPGAQTGAGATIASDTGESNMPPLAKLATAVQHFPEQKGGGFKEKMRQWLDSVGIPAKEQFFSKLNSLRAIPDWIKSKATTLPSVNDLDRRVGQWNGAEWENSQAAREFNTQIKAKFKDRSKLRALSNWINAAGDKELLALQAQLAKDTVTRKTYEDALKFGPEEEKLAAAVRHYHDEMLDRGQREGVLEEGLDNYLHRYYRDTDPVLEKKLAALRYMQFSKDFAGFKKRYYDSDFEAEQAGLKPEKDAAKRILAYDYGFNRALIAREFVRKSFDTEKAVAKDGRPELDIAGSGTRIEGDGKGVTLIRPKTRLDTGDPKDYRGDYVQFDHPAFKKWKFATTDSGGKPVLVQGDILVHPDFAKKYQALFEKSWWGKGPVRLGLMAVSNFTKQTMLQGPFHLFQITTGGIEHRIFSKSLGGQGLMDLNPSDPAQKRMAEAGLFAEQGSPYMTDGVSGGGLLDKIPIAGEYLQNSKDWLFNDYIPRWKMTLALTAEARNMERYKKDIQAGKITPEQVTRMSARQAAAVFGGQNQRAIFRSRSTQDTLRALFLAPDFGEERLRQVIQVTGKYGHEQRAALLAGGLGMMVLAKSIEKALTGSMNLSRPFTVTYNGKEYGMRNPASDIAHFVTDPIGYVRNRLNPIYTRPLLELANGRDQFGRKRTFGQQLTDEVKQVVPLPARGLVEKNQTILESLLNSTGITEHRKTAFGDEMQKINKWKESKGYTQPGEFVYDPDKDPYHSLTSQLSAGSDVSAQKELNGLVAGKSDVQRQKIYAHYKRSLATAPHLTGSKAHESEYVKGLSSSEKKAYDDAIAERKAMWQRFQKVWAKKDAK